MSFITFNYLIFFTVIVLFYFSIPYRFRNTLLLIGSYYFYMCWKPEYLILIVTATIVSYQTAIQIAKSSSLFIKKIYLSLTIIITLGILFFFKYYSFFAKSIHSLFSNIQIDLNVPILNVLLPVGISFYTFQVLSYTVDVYRGKKAPEKNIGIYALYVSFFPQLVAGPIERSTRLLPQFHEKHHISYTRVSSGLQLMLWGFFKKIVISDRLSLYVDAVYNNQAHHNGPSCLAATIFFAFQIYCDFSAYSDIAIGSAGIMGYDLMDNFKRPYFSRSIKEFWQRWHISLSTWFRDYFYIPLGGNRVNKWRWYFNLLAVFTVSGLWHGAKWTFVIWGAIHGLIYILTLLISQVLPTDKMDKIRFFSVTYHIILVIFTFSVVCLAWIFFRANSLHDAANILAKLTDLSGPLYTGQNLSSFFLCLFGITVLILIEIIQEFKIRFAVKPWIESWFIREFAYVSIILSIILFGVTDAGQFIYFQF